MLDFERLVKTVGGMPKLAALAGRSRTAVYHWRKARDLRVADLLRVCRTANLDPRDYLIVEENTTDDSAGELD